MFSAVAKTSKHLLLNRHSWGPPRESKTKSFYCCGGEVQSYQLQKLHMNNIWDWNARKCFRAQVADASPHQLLRGGCEWSLYAWSTAKKRGLNKTSRKRLFGPRKTRNGPQTSGNLNFALMGPGLRVLVPPSRFFARPGKDEQMFSTCVVPTAKDGASSILHSVWRVWVLCWWHGWCYLHLVGPLFVSTDNDPPPNTHPGYGRAIWPRRRVVECCVTWPDLHNHHGPQGEIKTANKCSAALRTPSGMLEHHPDQHMKLTETLPPMCKAVITEKRGHFEECNT